MDRTAALVAPGAKAAMVEMGATHRPLAGAAEAVRPVKARVEATPSRRVPTAVELVPGVPEVTGAKPVVLSCLGCLARQVSRAVAVRAASPDSLAGQAEP